MLRTLDNLLGYRLAAIDGEMGRVRDFLFDDASWKLRYLVVGTGHWLKSRRVLVAPSALGRIVSGKREFRVALTREQVRNSPDIDTDKPVSRQQERAMTAHYGWPAPDGMISVDPALTVDRNAQETEGSGDSHLRSFLEISTYRVEHAGETLGTAEDFVIDDANWLLRLLIIGFGGWIGSVQAAIPVELTDGISFADRIITTLMSKEEFDKLPLFDAEAPVNREEKLVYFDYRGRPAAQ
jgi:hypothetical protein